MKIFKKKKIYLDYASTTPVLPEVRKAMERFWAKDFYNPSAIYEEGVRIKKELENLRTRAGKALGVASRDIIFTGGGTEADNLAIIGVFEAARTHIQEPHIIISSLEHPAVSKAAKEVERRGGRVTIMPVNHQGLINPREVVKEITPSTVLVSIMLGNNEIGVVEPIAELARLLGAQKKKRNSSFPYIHTDASSAVNYLPITLPRLGVDLMTLDASKMYGPKGVGILVAKKEVPIHPISFGGGQERGLRSGTENLALISGCVRALEIALKDQEKETTRLLLLKNFFIQKVLEALPNLRVNGEGVETLPHIISLSKEGMFAEFVAIKLDQEGVMVSTGSACGNNKDRGGTETLEALGLPELRESTLRISLGRYTTKKEINQAIKIFVQIMRS